MNSLLKRYGAPSEVINICRCFSTEIIVSPEVAQIVALRPRTLIELPPDVDSIIHAAVQDYNRKQIKLHANILKEELKRFSRSKTKGGTKPNYYDPPDADRPPRLRGKPRQIRNQALQKLASITEFSLTSDETFTLEYGNESKTHLLNVEKYEKMAMVVATAGSHGNTRGGRGTRGSQLNKELALQSMTSGNNKASLQPSYDKMATAAAYAVARLPGCYAALYRVFEEISRLRPGWKPTSVLDFGAGPATATWAAREVWPDVKLSVSCVEQSPQMVNMGMLIANQIHDNEPHYDHNSSNSSISEREEGGGEEEDDQEEEDEGEDKAPPAPAIRWVQHLGGPNTRGRKVGGVSDLVVAAYVLGELRSDSERQRIVKKLWDRTKGMLVLVEPGTPSGAMNIMKARHAILGIPPLDEYSVLGREREGKGDEKGEGESEREGDTVGSVSLNVDCHVVAPCPHDGRCPLEGRRSWCHFATKYKRPYFQRIMGGPPSDGTGSGTGGPSLLGGYTTEKFSYVVLQRGERGRMRRDEGDADDEEEEEDGSLMMMMHDVSIEDTLLHNNNKNEEEEDFSDDDRMELMSEDDLDGDGGIDSEALKAAQMASISWSRLLRPPQTRKGHVLLDICSAEEGSQGRKGSLIRQIVSKGASKKALGGSTGAYRMARKAAWGDLWPGYYQRKMVNSREPPPTAKKEY